MPSFNDAGDTEKQQAFIIWHGARYTRVTKWRYYFSHPEFHKREAHPASLSRRCYPWHAINAIQQKKIVPEKCITHRIPFNDLKGDFVVCFAPERV